MMLLLLLLHAVRILVRSGWRAGEVSPVPVPLSGVRRRRLVLVLVLLLVVPIVVLSVFGSVGVRGRVGPGATSVIHDEPPLPPPPTLGVRDRRT